MNSKQRHIPIRMCRICRQRFPKKELSRFVKDPNNQQKKTMLLDRKQRMPGRGFYICHNSICREKIEKVTGWHVMCRGES